MGFLDNELLIKNYLHFKNILSGIDNLIQSAQSLYYLVSNLPDGLQQSLTPDESKYIDNFKSFIELSDEQIKNIPIPETIKPKVDQSIEETLKTMEQR